MSIQTKATAAICSSVGDVGKHEKFKKLSMEERINRLQEVYDTYGVKSNEFFKQVKPFIMWTIYRNLRGMPASEYLEDLVNASYEELVIAFEGGYTTHYNKEVYKSSLYYTDEYEYKYQNIGNFVMKVTSSSVAKYRSKTFRKTTKYEDTSEDISERINFTDFEEKYLSHNLQDPEINNDLFSYFKLNDNLIQHLQFIKATKPKNNILYNFMIWKELCPNG